MSCGNYGCLIREPKGVGTNGMCRCIEQFVRKHPHLYKGFSEFEAKMLTKRILTELREEYGELR